MPVSMVYERDTGCIQMYTATRKENIKHEFENDLQLWLW